MVSCKISAQSDNWELQKRDFYSNLTTFLALAPGPLDQFKFFLAMCTPLNMGGYIPKFQLSKSKTVGGVRQQRNKMATVI